MHVFLSRMKLWRRLSHCSGAQLSGDMWMLAGQRQSVAMSSAGALPLSWAVTCESCFSLQWMTFFFKTWWWKKEIYWPNLFFAKIVLFMQQFKWLFIFYKICALLTRLMSYHFILFDRLLAFCCHASLIRNVIKCIELEFDMTLYVLESVLKYRKD